MNAPVLTYPESVFKAKWPGWSAFLGTKKDEGKKEEKVAKKKGEK